MTSRSEEEQATLRGQIRELIAWLVDVEFSSKKLDQAFLANEDDIGKDFRPGQKQPRFASTYKRLFNFGSNGHKYLGTERTPASLAIDIRHIRCIWQTLTAFGYHVGPELTDSGPATWIAALTRMQAAVSDGLDKQGTSVVATPPLISHPRWRLVARPDLASRLLDRLEAVGAVALVGMPGIGKTVLARQVAAKAVEREWRVIPRDAGYWLRLDKDVARPARPSAANYVGLWADILRELARHLRAHPAPTTRARFDHTLRSVLQRWTVSSSYLEPGEKLLLRKIEERPTPVKLSEAIGAYAVDLRNPLLTSNLCAVLRLVCSDALIVLDNVSDIENADPACSALFAQREGDYPSPLKLLLTSQRATDNLAFLVGPQVAQGSAKLIDFGDARFSQKIVAAWSVAGEDDLTQKDADARIDLFCVSRIIRNPALNAEIDRVIAQVGGHALALAALASVWRLGGYKNNFWRHAVTALQAAPADILQLDLLRDPDRTIEKRHTDVLHALRLAWSLLDDGQSGWEATRDRFLDLGITIRNRPIDENVFIEFWKRAARGNSRERLGPIIASSVSPLRRLQAASFVQSIEGEAGKFALHDLHRILIEHELGGRKGLAARHQEFLRAFGWLDADGQLQAEEAVQFAVEEDRTVVRPDLGSDADEAETSEVGNYLLTALPHHVAGAAIDAAEAHLAALTTRYRFLQARLDAASVRISGWREGGNVEFLMSALQGVPASPVPIVRDAVRLAAEGIRNDRRQLAVQLLARLPSKQSSSLESLRTGASRYGPRPNFTPGFPFLTSRQPNLRARLAAAHGFKGAEWVNAQPAAPRVLTWSNFDLVLWNPELGEIDRSFPHGGDIGQARWIADAPDGPAILGWSGVGKRIALWDGKTGEPRSLIEADHALDEARWIKDAPGGPAILSWSKHGFRPICVWDARTGYVRSRVPNEGDDTTSYFGFGADWIPLTPDGPAILGWSRPNRRIHLWDIRNGEELLPIQTEDDLLGAAWIADALGAPGVLSWSARGGVRLWNARTGKMKQAWQPLSNEPARLSEDDMPWMCGAQWIPDGPHGPAVLWWSCFDHRLHLWDAASCEKLAELPHRSGLHDAQWIAESTSTPVILSRSRNSIHLWDTRTFHERGSVSDSSEALEGQWIGAGPDAMPRVLSRWRDGTIRLHDADLCKEVTRFSPREGVSGMEWIADAPGGPAIMTSASFTPGALSLWNPDSDSGKLDGSVRHEHIVWGVTWISAEPSKSEIMSWSADHTIRIWNAAQGRERLKVKHDASVQNAHWVESSAADAMILSCSDDRTIRLWDGFTANEIARVHVSGSKWPRNVSWIADPTVLLLAMTWWSDSDIHLWRPGAAPEQRRIVHEKLRGAQLVENVFGAPAIFSWAEDSDIRCWDPITGIERARLDGLEGLADVQWIPMTPEGPALLGWAKNHILLCDVVTGDRRFVVSHNKQVVGAAWIKDAWGKPAVLSSSYDRTIRLWDLNGTEKLRLDANDQAAPSAHWIRETPTGPAILSWSIIDRQIVLWDLETRQPRRRFYHDGNLRNAIWISDTERPAILSWAEDRTIRIWDATFGNLLARFDLDAEVSSVSVKSALLTDFEFAVGCDDGATGAFRFIDN